MRLEKLQKVFQKKKMKYDYNEVDGCGSIDFIFRGLRYHIWEYEDQEWGVETNVFHAGRDEDLGGDYESLLIEEIQRWPEEG